MFKTSASAVADPVRLPPTYLAASRQPLHVLVFLLPLVLAYEAGLALLLRSSEGVWTNKAHETLLQFFDFFGITPIGGLHLGGAAIVVVLLVWHLLNRDRWRVYPAIPGLMAVESLALTLPLIVLGLVINSRVSAALGSGAGQGITDLAAMDLWSRLAISIGAGLYEELVFRMLLIAVLHTLLVDVGGVRSGVGAAIAVVVSAAGFTVYHPIGDLASSSFYFLAGTYFGGVYVVRGFGIVVGVHAVYDIIIVSMLPGSSGG